MTKSHADTIMLSKSYIVSRSVCHGFWSFSLLHVVIFPCICQWDWKLPWNMTQTIYPIIFQPEKNSLPYMKSTNGSCQMNKQRKKIVNGSFQDLHTNFREFLILPSQFLSWSLGALSCIQYGQGSEADARERCPANVPPTAYCIL